MAFQSGVVYRLRDAKGRLLYVGMTSHGFTRWHQHAMTQPWWPDVARIDVEHFPTREDAAQAEENAIRNEAPLYNSMVYSRHARRLGIYRPYRTGSVYFVRATQRWCASIRWYGE